MVQSAPSAADAQAIARTRAWLEEIVIGLGLCPFAKAVHVKGQIRYFVSAARTPEALLEDLLSELSLLSRTEPELVDTTLLIHPHALLDFLDYNDFLSVVDAAIDDLDLAGELQVSSFHPQYQFEGNAPDDAANYCNRSPYPMLHLLREASVDRAVAVFPDASRIYEKNMLTLRTLVQSGIQRLLEAVAAYALVTALAAQPRRCYRARPWAFTKRSPRTKRLASRATVRSSSKFSAAAQRRVAT